MVGRYRDVLAATPVASLLNPGYVVGRNLVRDAFLDEGVRGCYGDLDDATRSSVSALRPPSGPTSTTRD